MHMRRHSDDPHYPVRLLLAFGLAWQPSPAADNDDLDIDKVNGSIHVPDNGDGRQAQHGQRRHPRRREFACARASTRSTAASTSTAARAIDFVETVNGGIQLGGNAKVAKTVEAVNGSITLRCRRRCRPAQLSNVNGGDQARRRACRRRHRNRRMATSPSARIRASKAACSSTRTTAGSLEHRTSRAS